MSQSIRQSNLFAGEEWTVLYRAFTQVNFNASDPASINRALRQYIQTNYPEDFNDWIESQEFIFILELLSWLAGTLAFKTDINARENFLETAESRESILRLARFLSYNPRRNQPATGLLKIVEVQTDDDVLDGYGNNLSNVAVRWNNVDDPDWRERFTIVMNNAFVANNQFGQPLKSSMIGGKRTQLYRFNTAMSKLNMGFTAQVAGSRMDFEVCNGDFETLKGFYEKSPNPSAAQHLFYRDDGTGNSSSDTGFFFLFKQGTMSRFTTNVPIPVENKLIPIDVPNINHTDVWVQTVSDSGEIVTEWVPTPALMTENNTFNSLPASQRNIFTVLTRDEDRINVRFSDGRFGNAPVGNMRVWYRVSNGERYTIRPQDIDRIQIPIAYINRRGVPRTLMVTLSLQDAVTNSVPRETDEQVRRRAPTVYSSQNRMVSGEDYNTFPLQSNLAVKMKAVNRVYSGHSRFVDLSDPTGTYQDVNVFADDGIFYREPDNYSVEVPLTLSRSPDEMIALYVQPPLYRQTTTDYVAMTMIDENGVTTPNVNGLRIRSIGNSTTTGRGYFINLDTDFPTVAPVVREIIQPGALIELQSGRWIGVVEVDTPNIGDAAPAGRKGVVFNEPVADGELVKRIIPRFNSVLSISITNELTAKFLDNLSFVLWFNPLSNSTPWIVRDLSVPVPNCIKIMTAEYMNGAMWRFTAPGIRHVFESENKIEWYFDGGKATDSQTGAQRQDIVRILSINPDVNSTLGVGLGMNYDIAITNLIPYTDGYTDPARVAVRLLDKDEDGVPDRPETFLRVVDADPVNSTLFWSRSSDDRFVPFKNMIVYTDQTVRLAQTPANGTVVFQYSDKTFWVYNTGWAQIVKRDYKYATGRGTNVAKQWITPDISKTPKAQTLSFQWKHYANTEHRIDPSKTNIIDIFVLTSEYDYVMRRWIATGAKPLEQPLPPSELDLRIALSEFESYKIFSDEIIWRPAKYKMLFGANSSQPVQFKVVKLASSTLSEGEIKSRVIRAVNDYFAVDKWDFGETFYYTELAAYIHQKLAGVIGSVVIVPSQSGASFGDGFEIKCRSDEVFISTAQINDVLIINSNTAQNLRIR